ncbi:MAG: PAS domain-containing protein [Desulfomonile tiedjei]|nr:PAS domain-containing protein [Desulfomonile tiedjei]
MFDCTSDQTSESLDGRVLSAPAELRNTATETINLSEALAAGMEETGTFDLRSLVSTSLGKLLDALPIPALLVDQWYGVVFSNEACSKIGLNGNKIYGTSFVDLLPRGTDTKKVAALTDKAVALLERAFATRRAQRAEAILEAGDRRLWARLHLRAVRMGSQRHVLVLVEDLTYEKAQAQVSRREENRLRQTKEELEDRAGRLAGELREVKRQLEQERALRSLAQESAQVAQQKFYLLAELCPHGIVLMGREGSFEGMNSKLRETFGYDINDIPNTSEWIVKMFPDAGEMRTKASNWLVSSIAADQDASQPLTSTVASKEGIEKIAEFTLFRLHDGNHLMMCEELATFGE